MFPNGSGLGKKVDQGWVINFRIFKIAERKNKVMGQPSPDKTGISDRL
jgi:hypothetical protein